MSSCASFQDYIPGSWETRKHVKTQGFSITPTQDPMFYSHFLLQVFKTKRFCSRSGLIQLGVAQQISARMSDVLKTTQKNGFENVRNIMHDKKQASA